MPDLTVEAVTICPMWASNFQVVSSKGDADYLCQFHKDSPPSCACKSYQYSGDYGEQTCKHLSNIKKYGCFYHPQFNSEVKQWSPKMFEKNGITWLSQSTDAVDDLCPGCGMPMVVVRIAV